MVRRSSRRIATAAASSASSSSSSAAKKASTSAAKKASTSAAKKASTSAAKKTSTSAAKKTSTSATRKRKSTRKAAAAVSQPPKKKAATAVGEGKKKQKKATKEPQSRYLILKKLLEQHTCPITGFLPVKPVAAEDGLIYEASALEKLAASSKHHISSKSKEKVGMKKASPSVSAKQIIAELLDSNVVPFEMRARYYIDRGVMKAAGDDSDDDADLIGAMEDFIEASKYVPKNALKLIESLKHYMNIIKWGLEGMNLCTEIADHDWSETQKSWFNGIVSRSLPQLILRDNFGQNYLTAFKQLKKGTKIRIIDDARELNRLCERAPKGYDDGDEVGWTSAMGRTAGMVGSIIESSSSSGSYDVEFMIDGRRQTHWYPYDSLALV